MKTIQSDIVYITLNGEKVATGDINRAVDTTLVFNPQNICSFYNWKNSTGVAIDCLATHFSMRIFRSREKQFDLGHLSYSPLENQM